MQKRKKIEIYFDDFGDAMVKKSSFSNEDEIIVDLREFIIYAIKQNREIIIDTSKIHEAK